MTWFHNNFLIFSFRPQELEFVTKVFLHGRNNFWFTTLKSSGISVAPFTRNEVQVREREIRSI